VQLVAPAWVIVNVLPAALIVPVRELELPLTSTL
jgi:hypothetical protein